MNLQLFQPTRSLRVCFGNLHVRAGERVFVQVAVIGNLLVEEGGEVVVGRLAIGNVVNQGARLRSVVRF